MEIMFKTPQQVAIANLLWRCDTLSEVEEVVRTYGHEATVVREMIELASIDEMVADEDLDLANSVIDMVK